MTRRFDDGLDGETSRWQLVEAEFARDPHSAWLHPAM
jgi:hypothetical protein